MTTAHLLILNAGSSSLKFALFEADGGDPMLLAKGQIEGLGTSPHLILRPAAGDKLEDRLVPKDEAHAHESALQHILDTLKVHFPAMHVEAVGHRVVHGGPNFAEPLRLTPEVIAELADLIPLAPLHQPHSLSGIEAAHLAFPDAIQIACFDTAFHRTHPWVNDTFALPRLYYEKGVRRYGFHGLSYEYVSGKLEEVAPDMAAGRVVIAHLGAGASMCAVKNGRSVASTMGFSPLDGLPMGTRCGQLDPVVVLYLADHEGLSIKEIRNMLYKDSGLKGLSGLSGDMRELEAAGTLEAEQAIDYFVFRIRRELGGLAAALGGLDAMVFCGGIGENSAHIRRRICEDLHWIGLDLDEGRNARGETLVSTATSRAKIFVIKTDEEAMIASHTQELFRRT
ncbi:MAG: acetate/propionate family kinase [Rhodomicrobium sp.]